jgi:hypothetical protein
MGFTSAISIPMPAWNRLIAVGKLTVGSTHSAGFLYPMFIQILIILLQILISDGLGARAGLKILIFLYFWL